MDKAWRQLIRWLIADVPNRIDLQVQPKPGDPWLSWSLNDTEGLGNMAGSMRLGDIPDIFSIQLQDWIALAQSQRPKDGNGQK